MNEEDWKEIVQLIQDELRGIGQDEIADLSNYEEREGTERFLPEPRYLVKEMLDALRRDMTARSSATVEKSLARMGQLIDGEKRPTEAIVWADRERSVIEGREPYERLDGAQGAPQAVGELEQLIGQLAEIGYGDDPQ